MTAGKSSAIIALGVLAVLGLSACNAAEDLQSAIRGKTGESDEYKAIRNQPLIVPPGFDQRPSREGGGDIRRKRSKTLQAPRRVVTGNATKTISNVPEGTAERALVKRARGGTVGVGNFVRADIDKTTEKKKSEKDRFTQKLLKWEKRKGGDVRKNPLGGKGEPVIKRQGEL